MTALPSILRLPANTEGRDFVVGDIHGAFDLVIDAMRSAKFDRARDRILSVGDLIDRGTGSERCLGFLNQPYVFAVRHDHDLTTIDHSTAQSLAAINFNGMKWLKGLPEDRFLAIQRALAALPIAMEIESPRGLAGIVHGDIPEGLSWQEFTRRIEAGDSQTIEIALTGRCRIQSNSDAGVSGIGRVFVGHTIQWGGLRRFGNVYAVDTGAVFREINDGERGALSMVNLVCKTEVLLPAAEKEAAAVNLFDLPSSAPFGPYARPQNG